MSTKTSPKWYTRLIGTLKKQPEAAPAHLIAGGAVYWYMEKGMRHFVMVKPSAGGNIRFVSCLGTGAHDNITAAVIDSTKKLLGSVFYKSLDKTLLAPDTVASVYSFAHTNENGAKSNVHGVFWCIQITPEQAQLCQPSDGEMDVVAVPEMSILDESISPSHQAVYQSISRHLHTHSAMDDLGLEHVEDSFGMPTIAARTIH